MSQELIAEYQCLLTEYSQVRRRASEIRDRISELHREIRTQTNAIPKIQEERVCNFCGSKDYYAKGYCRVCYSRAKRNGTPDPMPRRLKAQKPKTKRQLWNEMDWKDSLYKDVIGEDRAESDEVPEDFEKGIYYALSTLSNREEKIILCRYKNKLTYDECSGAIGENISRSRIGQIIQVAIRKLRCIPNIWYIQYGYRRAKEVLEEKRKEKLEENKHIKDEIEKARLIANEMQITKIEKLKQNAEICNISIEEFGLSTRAYNALCRANLRDRESVIDFICRNGGNIDCLIKIRNLGMKTIEEIINKLYIPEIRAIEP